MTKATKVPKPDGVYYRVPVDRRRRGRVIKTGPKLRVDVVEAARRPACLTRPAGGRAIEPGSAKVSLQRGKQLLARVQETAADIKTRP
jgi:hypothetical protein